MHKKGIIGLLCLINFYCFAAQPSQKKTPLQREFDFVCTLMAHVTVIKEIQRMGKRAKLDNALLKLYRNLILPESTRIQNTSWYQYNLLPRYQNNAIIARAHWQTNNNSEQELHREYFVFEHPYKKTHILLSPKGESTLVRVNQIKNK